MAGTGGGVVRGCGLWTTCPHPAEPVLDAAGPVPQPHPRPLVRPALLEPETKGHQPHLRGSHSSRTSQTHVPPCSNRPQEPTSKVLVSLAKGQTTRPGTQATSRVEPLQLKLWEAISGLWTIRGFGIMGHNQICVQSRSHRLPREQAHLETGCWLALGVLEGWL